MQNDGCGAAVPSTVTALAILGIFSLFLLAAAAEETTAVAAKNPKPFFAKSILFGAHRGGRGLWPESTLEAFRRCAEKWPGVMFETDVHLTADGVVVLIHDDTVDRTTDGTGDVARKTLGDLKALDAGYRFTRDGGTTFMFRGKGITVPTLEEALVAMPDSRFLIEMKNQWGLAEPTVRVIQKAKAEDRVALASFNPALMEQARKLEPRIAACYDIPEGLQMVKELREGDWAAYKPAADILAIDENIVSGFNLTAAELRAIHGKGIAISIHTINDPAKLKKYVETGFDNILTDRPDLLAEVLGR
jgi:glycerophosphoryl diester phosphodiesterase